MFKNIYCKVIAKYVVIALNLLCFISGKISFHLSTIAKAIASCHSFLLFKAMALSVPLLFAIALKSPKDRQLYGNQSWKSDN